VAKSWEYRGRWALVTGASAGIGEAFARALAERGMNLVLSARREDRLRALTVRLTREHGVRAEALTADLAQPGEATRLWTHAARIHPIHLLVNNAGFGASGAFEEIPLERQTEMIQVNCTSLLELAYHAVSDMRETGDGGVINVSSIAAFQPVPHLATYAASKAFVLSLSEALWAETRGSGVRILALCPGRTPTEFQAIAGTGRVAGSFGVRSAEAVVEAGLRALEADRAYTVPGWQNYLTSWMVRVLPRGPVSRVARRVVQRAARRT
jgi:uncharacterized protein